MGDHQNKMQTISSGTLLSIEHSLAIFSFAELPCAYLGISEVVKVVMKIEFEGDELQFGFHLNIYSVFTETKLCNLTVFVFPNPNMTSFFQ